MGGRWCLVGVDLGTTATKAALVREDGAVLAEAHVPTRLIQPRPGHVEQDPSELLESAVRAIRQVLEQSGVSPGDVAGVAFSGQMAGILLVDEQWEPVIPYDSWLDTRCTPQVQRMKQHAERIVELSGGPPTYSHGPKILFWMHEHPEVFARARKVIMPAGYVAGVLAGLSAEEAFIDPTYLHFSCLSDTKQGQWSDELCDMFDIPSSILPRIVEPWQIVGRLTLRGAIETGLRAGTPVVAGAGDQAAAMLGAGVVAPGMAYDAAGTASVLAVCIPSFAPDVKHQALLTARMVPAGLWYTIGYINGGGLNLQWFRDMLRGIAGDAALDYRQLDRWAAEVEPGARGLFFVPHLGGRVCPNQPDVRGAWIGLTWTHSLAHAYRALLESVAYEYAIYLSIQRELAPEATLYQVRVVGGGARSDLWNQIKADVLGIPYVRLNRADVGALGTAILAGYGVGVFADWEEAVRRFVHEVQRFEPDPEVTRRYAARAAFYRALLEEHIALWQHLAEVQAQ